MFFLLSLFVLVKSSHATLLTVPSPYPSLGAALAQAASGDVIEIESGIYSCSSSSSSTTNIANITIRAASSSSRPIFDCQGSGRALNIAASFIVLQGLGFQGGNAENGGAVLIQTLSPVGGEIVVRNCSFFNNTAFGGNMNDGGGGLAIISPSPSSLSISSMKIVIEDNIFTSNQQPQLSAAGGGGMIIFFGGPVFNTSIVFGSNNQFISNIGMGGGGGVLISFAQVATNTAIQFLQAGNYLNNNGLGGGGGGVQIYFEQLAINTFIQFQNGTFNNNNGGEQEGGGVQVYLNDAIETVVQFQGGVYNNNTAGGGGGVALLFQGNTIQTSIQIDGGEYTNNNVQFGGGGVQVFFNQNANATFIDVFGGNYIGNLVTLGAGGGTLLYFTGNSVDASVNVHGGFYSNNQVISEGPGGGGGGGFCVIFLGESNGFSALFRGGTFVGNIAAGLGGGGGIAVSFGSFAQSTAITYEGGEFSENAGGRGGGGGIWTDFFNDAANTSIIMQGGKFSSNYAQGSGGGVLTIFNGNATGTFFSVIGGNYDSNTAGFGGGGVFLLFFRQTVDTWAEIRDGMYTSNNAGYGGAGGGGLLLVVSADFVPQNLRISLFNLLFSKNYAPQGSGGGALISAQQGSAVVTINSCKFDTSNTGSSGGGLVVVLPPAISQIAQCRNCDGYELPPPGCGFPSNISFCSFLTTTTATVQNVFIPYQQVASLTLRNVSFINNTASCAGCEGGGMLATNGLVTLQNVTFKDNIASQRGGGMMITGNAQIITSQSVQFFDNIATTDSQASIMSTGSVMMNSGIIDFVLSTAPSSTYPSAEAPFFREFSVVQLSGTGNISMLVDNGGAVSSMSVTCPTGFAIKDTSIGSTLLFVDNWPNLMLSMWNGTSCSPCGPNTYSLSRGRVVRQRAHNNSNSVVVKTTDVDCLSCPFGGKCDYGGAVVVADERFWGSLNSASGEWKFRQCPLGYCCSNGELGCNPGLSDLGGGRGQISSQGGVVAVFSSSSSSSSSSNNSSSNVIIGLQVAGCAIGRNATTPLCGSCLVGYSQNMRNQECTMNGECDDGKWAWPLLLLFGIGWVVVMLITSGPKQRRIFGLDLSWIFPVLLFYFQNVSLIDGILGDTGLEAASTTVVRQVVSAMTNLHLQSSSSSSSEGGGSWNRVCMVENLSTTGSFAMRLAMPAMCGCMMGAIAMTARVLSKATSNNDEDDSKSNILSFVSRLTRSMRGRFSPALLKLLLLFYSSIATVSGILLQCVDVDMEGTTRSVIYRAGEVTCYTWWQEILWVVFGLLIVGFPLMLFVIQCWERIGQRKRRQLQQSMMMGSSNGRQQQQHGSNLAIPLLNEDSESGSIDNENSSNTINNKSSIADEVHAMVGRALRSMEVPYKPNRWYWQSVILVERLIVAIVVAFETDHAVQGLYLTFFFAVFMLISALAKPYRSLSGNVVDGLGMAVLGLMSAFIVRGGTMIETRVDSSEIGATANEVTDAANAIDALIYFVPGVVAIVVIVGEAVWCRWGKGREHLKLLFNRVQQHLFEENNDCEGESKDDVELSSIDEPVR